MMQAKGYPEGFEGFLGVYVQDAGDGIVIVGLALIAVWLLVRLADLVFYIARKRWGWFGNYEHCEHCDAVERIDEQLAAAGDLLRDVHAALEEAGDTLRGISGKQDEIVGAMTAMVPADQWRPR
jgi:hypothetical protein